MMDEYEQMNMDARADIKVRDKMQEVGCSEEQAISILFDEMVAD